MKENMIAFGRGDLGDLTISERKEWLITNGIGGFGSGTISGELTRKYHGILIASLNPPVNRTLVVSKMDEEARYGEKNYSLSTNRWADQSVSPEGYKNIDQFFLQGTIPTWRFAIADALIEKQIWMEQGENTTYVRYRVLRALQPVTLTVKAMVNWRGYHDLTQAGNWNMDVSSIPNGMKIQAFDQAPPVYLLSDAECKLENRWYRNYYLKEEEYRGLNCSEDHLYAGSFEKTLSSGDAMIIVCSLEKTADADGTSALKRRIQYEEKLIESFGDSPLWIRQLILAADQFIVDRPLKKIPDAKTIIAGYHWFTDWGRDTMISLPGLTLATGRPNIAKKILKTFSSYIDQGMLPNQFPDIGEKPEYNTVDAALWFFDAIRCYYEATQDVAFIREIYPVLEEMIAWHQKGTRYNIHVDPSDGLLYSGEPGVQLTWMDAKIGNFVVTPRTGKAVEINALWYNALMLMGRFSRALKKSDEKYQSAAELAKKNFSRFWNEQAGCCFDVIDGPEGDDAAIRPNQIFAVSLPESPLTNERQKKIVDIVSVKLLTSHGLKSLSDDNASYQGHYGGDQRQRDSAYHQGTVWLWLLGPFCAAHLKVYRNPEAAEEFLRQIPFHLSSAGMGSCSEIFDGDPPFLPRGCIAQAWSVAQILQAWQNITEWEKKQ